MWTSFSLTMWDMFDQIHFSLRVSSTDGQDPDDTRILELQGDVPGMGDVDQRAWAHHALRRVCEALGAPGGREIPQPAARAVFQGETRLAPTTDKRQG